MERLTAALENAGSLAALLDAAWDAFEVMIAVTGDHANTEEGFFAALVYALAAAANGRDAIIAAPSLPGRLPAEQPPRPGCDSRGGTVLDAAAWLAVLSGVLASQLESAATRASDHRDRAACLTGAQYAREVHSLLAWTQP